MGIKTDDIFLSQKIVQDLSDVEHFNGRWPFLKEKIENSLSSLKHVTTIASIGSSTRIEGVTMSDDDIVTFFLDIKKESFLSRDQQEVLGYKDLLEEIFDSYAVMDISENIIKQLHQMLLSHSEKDTFHLGHYKKLDNNVVAQKHGKNIGVIFKTTSPFDTPQEMQNLIQWYSETNCHALVKCALFVVHFLAIHPFQDGNGRLSRALTNLILLKEGYLYVPFCSLESVIEKNKSEYYQALRRTQKSFLTDKSDYSPWLHFFFSVLKKQTEILSITATKSQPRLSKIQQSILHYSGTVSSFKNSDIVQNLSINRNTAKINLKKLVELKMLNKSGTGKGTSYRKKLDPHSF